MEKSCYTCAYAIITIVSECCKNDESGKYIHTNGLSPKEMICSYWEQADESLIRENSFDWSKAIRIKIDGEI